MKVIAYVRVSTSQQAEEGLGLEVQEQAIRSWARAHRHKIVAVVADQGVSGTKELDDRPGLAEALAMVGNGFVGGICVARLDRLARDLVLQEQLLAEVRRQGGDVFTTSTAEAGYLTDDPDDPSRRLIRQVLGAIFEYERAMIGLRLRAGRRRKAEKGGFAYGSPPLGWRAERGQLVVDDAESAALARMVELRNCGESLRGIATVLADEGHRTKRGARWHPQTVARALQSV
ncbi:MAG: recombinase family protein [Acidimicrobiales bacterium]